MRSSWQAWRLEFTWLTLVGVLVQLVGALVCPRSHFRNGCICCSRCSVEALVDCRFQALVGDKKGGWGRGAYELEGVSRDAGNCDPVGG